MERVPAHGIRQRHQPFNTAEYDYYVENEFTTVKSSPLSTFSVDVDTASYSNVRRFLMEGSLPPAGAVRIEELINYFNYDYPLPDEGKPVSMTTHVTSCPWNPQRQLLHVGLRTKPIPWEKLPPSNLTFLIDVSGSMMPQDRLPLIKKRFAITGPTASPRRSRRTSGLRRKTPVWCYPPPPAASSRQSSMPSDISKPVAPPTVTPESQRRMSWPASPS